MIKKIFICCFLLCLVNIQAQQNLRTSFLNFNEIKKEVFGQWVSSVQQDKDGFIWVATQDGLYKYDGKNFKTFRYNPADKNSLPANWVRSINQDKNDVFWLATLGSGLVKFEEKKAKFTAINLSSKEFPHNPLSVYDVISTSKSVWVVSEDGLHRKSTTDSIFALISKPKSSIQVHQLNDGSEIVMFENTLFNFNDKTNVLEPLLENIQFGRILVTHGKSILFRSEGRIFKYNFVSSPKEIKIPNGDYINLMSNLQNGKCILGGVNKNYTFDAELNTFKVYNYNIDQFRSLGINELFLDKQDLLWLATTKGLFKESLLGKVFTGSIDIHARRMLKDSGTMYVGGGKGLTEILFNDEIIEQKKIKETSVTSLCKTKKGIWFGDYYGRVFFKNKTGKIKTINLREKNEISQRVYGIVEDKNNRVWVSSLNEIYVFNANGDILNSYSLKSKNKKTKVKIIRTLVDNNDNLWAITIGDGVYRIPNISDVNINENRFSYKHYIHNTGDKNSINSDVVMEIHLSPKGEVWIGLDYGINRYNKETDYFEPLIIHGNFFDKKIMAIETDANDLMWISTINDGIYVYDSLNSRLFNLREEDGLISNACLFTSSLKDENTLYFGTDKGIQIIDASLFSYPEVITTPKFTILSIKGEKPEVFEDFSIDNQPISINYNQSDFSVSFAITDYRFPKKINYYYKLGDTDYWTKSDDNTINFNSLNYGNCNLQVKAAYQLNDDAPIASLALKINPPWYKTIAAYVLLFLMVASILYYFFQLRYKQKLASTKLNAIKELDNIKSNLFTNISHELRTPLTLISGPIEHQLSKNDLKTEDREELNLVKQNADRLLNLVNQLMDLALIDSGQLKLTIKEGNLNLFLKQTTEAFQYQAEKKNIKIRSEIEQLQSVWFDRDSIEKIVVNLLSNAVKYATTNSFIEFKASQQNDVLVLSVANSSHKTNKDLVKLFERFYQNDASADGVGVGLALVKELVMLNNGTILANKLQEDKIQFTVTLPIVELAFNTSEIEKIKTSEEVSVLETNLDNETVILIVEDDDDIRTFTKSIFKKQYKIIEAVNGEEGVIMALQHIPDLIISDVMMPIKDGVSLCNDLKNNQLTSHIPIVLLTARVGEEHEIEGLKTGADAYITKPFSLEKLKTRVEKLLEGRTQLQKHYSKGFDISSELKITSTETEFLKRLEDTLKTKITNSDFTSERFAEAMLMSRTQLHRKLKAIVNMTASEFIRKERLKLAIQLLKESDGTVAEIAYQVGFNSSSYFIKCFKDIYNCTPNEYLTKS